MLQQVVLANHLASGMAGRVIMQHAGHVTSYSASGWIYAA